MNGRPFAHDRWNDPFPDMENLASATECTGLMPAKIPETAQGVTLSDLENIHRIKPSEEDKGKKD